MRVVYAVGSHTGWPFEVYALFDEEADGRRHAEASAYAFDVFPLAVYDSYDDIPPAARAANAGRVAGVFAPSEDEIEFARLVAGDAQAGGQGNPTGCVYSARGFNEREPEVYALYTTADEAQRHVTEAAAHMTVVPIEVYAGYETCPPDKRYATDHGNVVAMKEFEDPHAAEAERQLFASRGHHQHYWIENTVDPPSD